MLQRAPQLWPTVSHFHQYQEPITEEHASTIGVCDNCPPLKEVINSPWPQLARDQEVWVGGDTCRQSAAFSKGQWVWCKGQYHAGCASLRSSKNSNHMLTPLVSIYCTNSKWWISSRKNALVDCISFVVQGLDINIDFNDYVRRKYYDLCNLHYCSINPSRIIFSWCAENNKSFVIFDVETFHLLLLQFLLN